MSAISLIKFQFTSPPEIEVSLPHERNKAGRLKVVLEAFKKYIFFEAQNKKIEAEAEKIGAEAELVRQKAMAQALTNYEHALKIEAKIPDTERKKLFIENLVVAIEPFVDKRHPKMKEIDITQA